MRIINGNLHPLDRLAQFRHFKYAILSALVLLVCSFFYFNLMPRGLAMLQAIEAPPELMIQSKKLPPHYVVMTEKRHQELCKKNFSPLPEKHGHFDMEYPAFGIFPSIKKVGDTFLFTIELWCENPEFIANPFESEFLKGVEVIVTEAPHTYLAFDRQIIVNETGDHLTATVTFHENFDLLLICLSISKLTLRYLMIPLCAFFMFHIYMYWGFTRKK